MRFKSFIIKREYTDSFMAEAEAMLHNNEGFGYYFDIDYDSKTKTYIFKFEYHEFSMVSVDWWMDRVSQVERKIRNMAA